MREQIFLFVFAIIFTNSSCKNIFAINSYSEAEADELVSVVVLYRHGDRSPISSYPTDPYIDSSYWPEGYGQLLNKGKERQYQLGEWFRKRYSTFLPNEYSPKDIRVVSTDVDRTLMSAAANLAGLYPPHKIRNLGRRFTLGTHTYTYQTQRRRRNSSYGKRLSEIQRVRRRGIFVRVF
ncbi:hypothetical protein NQ318_007327 [Aromia moschata]|uniref:acid phosphatase n=1 Tax=Aromia moschata TaxID=1265417 RepID=A0AAV8Z1B9_9CUCU|nr:hypothetical protein NQ318_007327 [Aromia moschata]